MQDQPPAPDRVNPEITTQRCVQIAEEVAAAWGEKHRADLRLFDNGYLAGCHAVADAIRDAIKVATRK